MLGKFYLMQKGALFLCIATPAAIVIKDPGPKVARTVAKAKHWTNRTAKRLHRAPVFAEAIAEPRVGADRIDTLIVPAICPPTEGGLSGGGGLGFGSSGFTGGIGGGGAPIGGGGGGGGLPDGPIITRPPVVPVPPTTAPAVPEPATYGMLGAGIALIGATMRRRRAAEVKA